MELRTGEVKQSVVDEAVLASQLALPVWVRSKRNIG